MYVVEIRREGDGLAEPMAAIRTWLDRKRVQPSAFRLSMIPGGTIFRLEFRDASEAEAFARAFSELLDRKAAEFRKIGASDLADELEIRAIQVRADRSGRW